VPLLTYARRINSLKIVRYLFLGASFVRFNSAALSFRIGDRWLFPLRIRLIKINSCGLPDGVCHHFGQSIVDRIPPRGPTITTHRSRSLAERELPLPPPPPPLFLSPGPVSLTPSSSIPFHLTLCAATSLHQSGPRPNLQNSLSLSIVCQRKPFVKLHGLRPKGTRVQLIAWARLVDESRSFRSSRRRARSTGKKKRKGKKGKSIMWEETQQQQHYYRLSKFRVTLD